MSSVGAWLSYVPPMGVFIVPPRLPPVTAVATDPQFHDDVGHVLLSVVVCCLRLLIIRLLVLRFLIILLHIMFLF